MEMNDVHLSWLICPCGCGKEASFQTNIDFVEDADYEKLAQEIWQSIVNKEGLEKAIEDVFHKEERRQG